VRWANRPSPAADSDPHADSHADPHAGGNSPAHQLSSFTATPGTLRDGDELTLAWTGDAGLVSVSIKGGASFIMGRPSTGNHVLRSGMAGYPPVGQTTYQAANSDVGVRLEATVTVTAPTPEPTSTPPPAAPTISLSAAASSCYPVKAGNAGCDVSVTATASNYSSITWSGCCSGSGTTAACHINDLDTPHDCTATATGPGGSAHATTPTVTGTNSAPVVAIPWRSAAQTTCDSDVEFVFDVTEEERVASCPTIEINGACSAIVSAECPMASNSKKVRVVVRTWSPPKTSQLGYVGLVVRDPWGVNSPKREGNVGVDACP
jgi:hypothetical protein